MPNKPAPESNGTSACPHCGAKQIGPSETCWLCGKFLSEKVVGLPPYADVAPREPETLSFSLATMLLLVTLASVCMGLLVTAPGLGVLACVIMVPVFFRTLRVVRHREALGREVSSVEKVSLFVGSFAVSTVLVIVVCVSAFCSFCGLCLTIVSLGDTNGDMLVWGLGMCAVATVSIVIMIRLIRFARRRYQRDMGEE